MLLSFVLFFAFVFLMLQALGGVGSGSSPTWNVGFCVPARYVVQYLTSSSSTLFTSVAVTVCRPELTLVDDQDEAATTVGASSSAPTSPSVRRWREPVAVMYVYAVHSTIQACALANQSMPRQV